MIRLPICLCATLVCLTIAASAQGPSALPSPTAPPPIEDDAVLKLAEPDFTIISLPTSLRLPKYKSAFRVTHRFTRPISCDSCSNSFWGDGFGTDGGAAIGLEYRVGIVPNGEIVLHRTSRDKAIEVLGQYGLTRQGRAPVETAALAAVDINYVGAKGAPSQYSPALGLIVTRLIGDQAAVYLEPIWVHHTNLAEPAIADNDTFMVGLGARIRISPTVYIVGEFAPRASGYKPGVNHGSFAIEKRAGGHLFQLNFSDSFGTTLSQIARGGLQELQAGGATKTNWYMGFNISRKFY
jgi:uncharacterized beta barrel domain-containing protein DUF5777